MPYPHFLKIPRSTFLRRGRKVVAESNSKGREEVVAGPSPSLYRHWIAVGANIFSRSDRKVGKETARKHQGPSPDLGQKRYQGWVGISKNGKRVNGWLADFHNLDQRLQVMIRADDITIGPVLADKPRPALIEKGVGDGCYGFSVLLPESKSEEGGVTFLSVHPVENLKQAIVAAAPGERVTRLQDPVEAAPAEDNELGASLETGWEALISVEQTPFADFMKPYVDDVRALLDQKEWGPLAVLGRDLLTGQDLRRLLFASARALFFEKKFDEAARLFAALRAIAPDNEEAKFHHSVCLARLGENRAAAEQLRQLYAAGWQPVRVAREFVSVLVDLMRASGHESNGALQSELIAVTTKLVAAQPDVILRPLVLSAIGHAGQQALALRLFDNEIARHPNGPRPYVAKSRFLLSISRIEEALEISEHVLKRWPDNEQARFDLHVFAKLRGMKAVKETIGVATVSREAKGFGVSMLGEDPGAKIVVTTTRDLLRRLSALDTDWAIFTADGNDDDVNYARARGHAETAAAAGCIRLSPTAVMWRTRALEGLRESGLLADGRGLLDILTDLESQYRHGEPARSNEGVALLISRHGSVKFGGVEQFMASAAEHYRSLGYEPILLGTRPDMTGQSGREGGIDFEFISDSPAAIRKYAVEKKATLLHTFPGLGYQVAEALQYHSARFVYGIHYWRDSLGSMTSDVFFDDDGKPIARPEFSFVLARASTAYVNSKFTQAIIETAHGIRCPIVYSVPAD